MSKCFPSGTLVRCPLDDVTIETLVQGDAVLALSLKRGGLRPVTVCKLEEDVEVCMLKFCLSGADWFICSPTQRIWNGARWLLSGKIRDGDSLAGHIVVRIEQMNWTKPVYTLVLTTMHNYVVLTKKGAPIVVHDNSSDLGYPAGFAPAGV